MIEVEIEQLVKEHYDQPKAGILLLSKLGTRLVQKGVWPPEGEKRSLYEIADAMPSLSLVREDEKTSFIPVTLKGDEQRAHVAIADRQKRFFLRGLPRPLLLAFTLGMDDGQRMSVSLEPKVRFRTAPSIEHDMIIVDDDLRLAGLDVTELDEIDINTIARLEANIKTWCGRHDIDPSSLPRARSRQSPKDAAPSPAASPPSSALERLYAAQDPDVARRLIIPADVALALSRMP